MYYIALVIIALIFIARIVTGFKRGMVKEIISIISLIIAVVCIALIVSAVGSYMDEKIGKTIQMVLILFAVCIVYRLVNVLFTSLKLISELPVINWLNKLLGAVLGAGEAVLIVGLLVHFIKNWGLSVLL